MNRLTNTFPARKSRIRRALMLAFVFATALPLIGQTPAATTATLPGHVVQALSRATLLPHTPAMDEAQIKLTVVLSIADPAGASAMKAELSDANSPNFHHTMSTAEYTSRFGPTQESYDAVLAYLEANGLTLSAGSDNRRTITVHGTRDQAQKAFHVVIDDYQMGTRNFHAITTDPVLPANIAPLVVSVFGLSNAAQLQPVLTPYPWTPTTLATAYDGTLTPAHQTNTGGLPPGVDGYGQTIGLLEFDGFDPNDVKHWLKYAGLDSKLIDHLSSVPIEGGTTPSGCTQTQSKCGTTEALLDIEAAMGIAQGANIVVYDAPPGTDLAEALNLAKNTLANAGHGGALSVSWAECEGDISQSDATGLDGLLDDLTFYGITIFASSGDTGSTCVDPDGKYPGAVAFPADASNVVAVGGTALNVNPDNSYISESWWKNSGGYGVSQWIAKPSYQDKLYPLAGHRSVPDLSMEAAASIVICQATASSSPDCGPPAPKGGTLIWGGTSLSAPLWAATWTIANQVIENKTGSWISASDGYFYGYQDGFHKPSSMTGTGNDFAHVGLGSPDMVKLIAKLAPPRIDSYSPQNGAASGGTKITIDGAGFIGVEKVTFGGVAGTHLTIFSDTKLTIETPEAPGEFATIKVETPGGTATAAGPYTYNPEISEVSPPSGPLQGGTTVTIKGLALSSSDETFLFGEAKATKVSCPTSKQCMMQTPANAPGIVAVEATTPWGYGYSPITKSTVYTYQTVEITSFTPGFGPTAGGEFVQIYGHSLGLGTGTKISFGGAYATDVYCPGPSYCYMNSPAHALGKAPITVTTSGLTSPPSKDQFTFETFPTVTAISPAQAKAGTTVMMTGTGFSTTAGKTQFSFFGVLVNGNCSSTLVCSVVVPAVDLGLGAPLNTAVYVTVNGLTSLDWVEFSYPGKPSKPPCTGTTCS